MCREKCRLIHVGIYDYPRYDKRGAHCTEGNNPKKWPLSGKLMESRNLVKTQGNLFPKVVNLQSVSHMKLSHLFEIGKGEISIRAGKTQGIYKYYLSVDPE